MPIAKASNNGGRYNTVHNQTDDGSVISVLVDGPFVQELYDAELQFRGSSKQRIIKLSP